MSITLYTTHCPKCEVLYKKLEAAGLQFEICENVDELVDLGFKTVPILKVDEEFLDFKKAVDWIKGVQQN